MPTLIPYSVNCAGDKEAAGEDGSPPHPNHRLWRTVMKTLMQKFLRDESGATMVEYGIMVALIAAIAIGIVGTLGGNVRDAFTDVNTALEGAQAPAGGGEAGGA